MFRSQVDERLGNRASNLKVARSIPSRAKLRCVLVLHPTCIRGTVPVLTASCSG